jgi:beta-galactosidase
MLKMLVVLHGFCFVVLLWADHAMAQDDAPRLRYSINSAWKFYPEGIAFGQRADLVPDTKWDIVNLPHTWNALDPFDDQVSYRRGISWYRKYLQLGDHLRGKRLFLYFEGANQEADVYVNGAFAGNHKGGYTAFAVEITDLVNWNKQANLVAVQVDNSHDPMIPPLSVGYGLYGGIYRDVWLIATDDVHFEITDHAAPGVQISTPQVGHETAGVAIRAALVNDSEVIRTVEVLHTIYDADHKEVHSVRQQAKLEPGSQTSVQTEINNLVDPHLWSPDDPYLYQVSSRIIENDRVLDEIRNPLGFRWFRFDADQGFFLNGDKLQLKGTNRHQDYAGQGPAISNVQHVRDLNLIRDMGCNFLRLAHYPQDPAVLEAADRLGLLLWEEIPMVNYMTTDPRFLDNAKTMLREMIRQHHNHPSVIMWGSMNEIFLWSGEGARSRSISNMQYAERVHDYAVQLDNLIRAEDPERYTAMAVHGSDIYEKTGVAEIPQLLGVNLYHGWYGGVFDGFGRDLDRRHARNPGQILFVSEYGAGSDRRLNSAQPQRFDFTGQWQRLYHEAHIRQINARPWLAGTAIWNQFDFSQPHTGGSITHLNQKGMMTWDRIPKDVYYLYKANWNPEPMVYIASRDWPKRIIIDTTAADADRYTQPLDIYTNFERVQLVVNGVGIGAKESDGIGKVSWDVQIAPGLNTVEAVAGRGKGRVADRMEIEVVRIPYSYDDRSQTFSSLGINVGSNAQYQDAADRLWAPDIAGGFYACRAGEMKKFHKDTIIRRTGDVPLYYTYREGIKSVEADLPQGRYAVQLHFAEPEGLPPGGRVFDIVINGRTVADDLDLAAQYGHAKAVQRTFAVTVGADEKLEIAFEALNGKTILNAIRITKQ